MSPKNWHIIAGTAVAAAALDQATKALVLARLPYGQPVPVAPFVWLTHVHNTGAAFSMFAGFPAGLRVPFFLAVTVLALAALAWAWRGLPRRGWLESAACGLIVGGAVGNNFIDRPRFGAVVDFIEVGVRGVYTWPVFNVADSCLTVGVVLLALCMLRKPAEDPAA